MEIDYNIAKLSSSVNKYDSVSYHSIGAEALFFVFTIKTMIFFWCKPDIICAQL